MCQDRWRYSWVEAEYDAAAVQPSRGLGDPHTEFVVTTLEAIY